MTLTSQRNPHPSWDKPGKQGLPHRLQVPDREKATAEVETVTRWWMTLTLALFAAPAWAQSNKQNIAQCVSNDPDAKIAGCTALIESGEMKGEELAIVYNNRGIAYDFKYLRDQAIADFNHAITLWPEYFYAFYNRGIAYQRQGHDDKAIADFTRAIALKSDYVDAYKKRAGIYEQDHHYDGAIVDFTKVLALKPDDAAAYQGRAVSYSHKGLREQAIADYRMALKIDPTMQAAHDGLNDLGALPPGGAQAVIAGLVGATWTTSPPDCAIRQIEFIDGTSAKIQLVWQVDVALWTATVDQIKFDFREWDAQLSGTIVSANEINLSFKWTTTDHMPHIATCKASKKH